MAIKVKLMYEMNLIPVCPSDHLQHSLTNYPSLSVEKIILDKKKLTSNEQLETPCVYFITNL